jgi:N-methylhydantoinase B
MRFFTFLRILGIFAGCLAQATGGRIPGDQETIRIWGIHGWDERDRFFLFREVLGGGSGGRWYADGSDVIHIVPNSRNLPAEFSETRYPILVEQLALKQDSGGPGAHRGGLGYHKKIRVLQDVKLLSNADRSLLATYGVNQGSAGGNYRIRVEQDGDATLSVDGLSDDIPVSEGEVIEIITTGGGGWGDPLERDPELVRLDVLRGVVSAERADDAYGVVLSGSGESIEIDEQATENRRAEIRSSRPEPGMFDRGAYFAAAASGNGGQAGG